MSEAAQLEKFTEIDSDDGKAQRTRITRSGQPCTGGVGGQLHLRSDAVKKAPAAASAHLGLNVGARKSTTSYRILGRE